jgi:hypothetical protein
MKKLLKIAGIVTAGFIAVAALGAFIFWWGWLRAPSPETVCDHMVELYIQETGIAAPESYRQECIRKTQPPEFGKLPYAAGMKCMLAAESVAEMKTCAKG